MYRKITNGEEEEYCRNPLSIQVCFNYTLPEIDRYSDGFGRNPLSIQVCFNDNRGKRCPEKLKLVVIPYQFRSVSI